MYIFVLGWKPPLDVSIPICLGFFVPKLTQHGALHDDYDDVQRDERPA